MAKFFCANETGPAPQLDPAYEQVKQIYTYLCPVIIFICLISMIFNATLICISRQSRLVNKRPILLLSLNLAITDFINAFLNGVNIFFNSYMPMVHNCRMPICRLLILEILRCTAMLASALHLLALAIVHYQGTFSPLLYRWVSPIVTSLSMRCATDGVS